MSQITDSGEMQAMPETTRRTLEKALLEPAMTAVVALPSANDGGSLAEDAAAADVVVLVVPIAVPRNGGLDSNGSATIAVPAAGNGGEERGTPQPRPTAVQVAIAYDVDVACVAELNNVSGQAAEILIVPAPRNRDDLPAKLILLGVGDESAKSLRRAGAALAKATTGGSKVRASVVDGLDAESQRAFTEGFLLGGYRAPRAGVTNTPKPMARQLELTGADEETVRTSVVTAQATWLTRNLTNMPSNVKNPEWMAAQSRRLAESAGLNIRVWDEKQIAAEGFGGLTAVGGAASAPPRLVQLGYTPDGVGAGDAKHIVLVGKGITFDTGGISLKPREAMMPMKTDMAGAAVVLSAIQAAAELGVEYRVTALLALAENAIGAESYRPGDVVTAFGGTTIEVGNTDAEGRMVLADALAYAVQELAPDVLIDVATLTGAAAVGLGKHDAALFSNADGLTSAFQRSGDATGERVWPMPLVEDYTFALKSPIADFTHIPAPSAKIQGGSIFAALFLREFVGVTPWVHLDIAGPARADTDQHEISKGATGYGTRLLLNFLREGF
ncbi:leucyl aminopeptidase family protein [Arthrobacter monumenti]